MVTSYLLQSMLPLSIDNALADYEITMRCSNGRDGSKIKVRDKSCNINVLLCGITLIFDELAKLWCSLFSTIPLQIEIQLWRNVNRERLLHTSGSSVQDWTFRPHGKSIWLFWVTVAIFLISAVFLLLLTMVWGAITVIPEIHCFIYIDGSYIATVCISSIQLKTCTIWHSIHDKTLSGHNTSISYSGDVDNGSTSCPSYLKLWHNILFTFSQGSNLLSTDSFDSLLLKLLPKEISSLVLVRHISVSSSFLDIDMENCCIEWRYHKSLEESKEETVGTHSSYFDCLGHMYKQSSMVDITMQEMEGMLKSMSPPSALYFFILLLSRQLCDTASYHDGNTNAMGNSNENNVVRYVFNVKGLGFNCLERFYIETHQLVFYKHESLLYWYIKASKIMIDMINYLNHEYGTEDYVSCFILKKCKMKFYKNNLGKFCASGDMKDVIDILSKINDEGNVVNDNQDDMDYLD